jgi:hypothetical protein
MSRKQSEVAEHRTYKIDKQQCWTYIGAKTSFFNIRCVVEDEYDTLKHTVDKGEEQLENNVYASSLGVCDGVDPTYNSI